MLKGLVLSSCILPLIFIYGRNGAEAEEKLNNNGLRVLFMFLNIGWLACIAAAIVESLWFLIPVVGYIVVLFFLRIRYRKKLKNTAVCDKNGKTTEDPAQCTDSDLNHGSTFTFHIDLSTLQSELSQAFVCLCNESWVEANQILESFLDANPEDPYAYVGKMMCDYHISKLDAIPANLPNLSENKNYKHALQFAEEDLLWDLKSLSSPISESQTDSDIHQERISVSDTLSSTCNSEPPKTVEQPVEADEKVNRSPAKKRCIVPLIICLVLLAGSIGANIYQYSMISDKESEISSLETEVEKLETEKDETLAKYKKELSDKNSEISALTATISSQGEELESLEYAKTIYNGIMDYHKTHLISDLFGAITYADYYTWDEVVTVSKGYDKRFYIHSSLYTTYSVSGGNECSSIEWGDFDSYGNCDVLVTGKQVGTTTYTFTNEKNDHSFTVLVVVHPW